MPDLWILAGQSNMEGVGDLVDVEATHPQVRVFAHGDEWKTAEEPLHWLSEANDPVHWGDVAERDLPLLRSTVRATRTKGTGCALTFAKTIVEATGNPVDLLPTAHGGTSMAQWSPSLKHLGGRSLYGALLRRVKLALETSPQSELKGILWYQGESETEAKSAKVYEQRMIELVAELRSDLESPELPFFTVQLGCVSFPKEFMPGSDYWTTIRESQRKLPAQIPGLGMAPAIDLSLDDLIHISTPGLKRLGKRLANLALREVYGKDAPTSITLESARIENETSIRVQFGGVNGRLKIFDLDGRIPGFSLVSARGSQNAAAFYKTVLDAAQPGAVLLYAPEPIAPGNGLAYGYGLFPFCQLVDEADMAAPAFGPIALS